MQSSRAGDPRKALAARPPAPNGERMSLPSALARSGEDHLVAHPAHRFHHRSLHPEPSRRCTPSSPRPTWCGRARPGGCRARPRASSLLCAPVLARHVHGDRLHRSPRQAPRRARREPAPSRPRPRQASCAAPAPPRQASPRRRRPEAAEAGRRRSAAPAKGPVHAAQAEPAMSRKHRQRRPRPRRGAGRAGGRTAPSRTAWSRAQRRAGPVMPPGPSTTTWRRRCFSATPRRSNELIAFGKWPDKADSRGMTPLMLARCRAMPAWPRRCSRPGPNPNRPGPGGATATSIARERKRRRHGGPATGLRGTLASGLLSRRSDHAQPAPARRLLQARRDHQVAHEVGQREHAFVGLAVVVPQVRQACAPRCGGRSRRP